MFQKMWQRTRKYFSSAEEEEYLEEAFPPDTVRRHYLPLPLEVTSLFGIHQAHKVSEEEVPLEYPIAPEYRERVIADVMLAMELLRSVPEEFPGARKIGITPQEILFSPLRSASSDFKPATRVAEKVYTSMGNLTRHPFKMTFQTRRRWNGREDWQEIEGEIYYDRRGEVDRLELRQEQEEGVHHFSWVREKGTYRFKRLQKENRAGDREILFEDPGRAK